MARSNSANGGTSYYDLVFQLVSDDGVTQVVRAVIYLTSRNVVDSVNTLNVGGNYSRGGAQPLNGVYNSNPIWYQDIAVGRGVGYNYNISVDASWSAVEYWGTTLSASEVYTVPARYEAPSPPPTGVDQITPTSARILVWPSTYGGGAGIDTYEAYVMTNNAWPGAGGNVVASAAGGTFIAAGLLPSTTYFYTARSRNQAGIWSGWQNMGAFTTLPSALVKVGGVWRNAIPYVKLSGVWRQAQAYTKYAGVWR